MKKYISKLKGFLNKNKLSKQINIVATTEDMYIVHVYGYKKHSFSVKIATGKEKVVCFFGYNKEIILPLSDENFDTIIKLMTETINYGTRFTIIKDEEEVGVYEFIANHELTPDEVFNMYKEEREASGKELEECTIICSDFGGNRVFVVEVPYN